jgi:hypothetical protein
MPLRRQELSRDGGVLGRNPVAVERSKRVIQRLWQLLVTSANGQPAVAGYLWDAQTTAFRAETIIVLTFQAALIEEITAFRAPELFPRFGLPEQLTNDVGATTALAPAPSSHHVSLTSLRPIEEDAP